MMYQAIAVGIARHALTMAAGWLVAKGYFDQDAANQAVGLVVGLVGVALSAHDKAKPVGDKVLPESPSLPDKQYPL